ncbi:hypothetical protein Sjap_017140 [Stephania japonica]|uniref:ZF-HD dimerization-type domain-containing protein n=1 Tax=Stephania japonica TaxID=461633 RepID=A0AAP0I5P7_9MAGN
MSTTGGGGGGGGGGSSATPHNRRAATKYRECLKNHALGLGVHAVDGCGEFMPAGEEGTLDALKCAACNCHRNFHRKEVAGQPEGIIHHHHQHQLSPYYRGSAPGGYLAVAPHRLALPSTSREDQDDGSNGNPNSAMKKRFRTKFTQEQKDRMQGFSESVGWRIQKQDEEAVRKFCEEINVKRHVLKVWMHNNKHTLGKK